MKLDRVALGVGVLALAAAGLTFIAGRGVAPHPHIAVVVLGMVNGQCQVIAKDNPVWGNPGGVIVWDVTNECDAEQTFLVSDFVDGDPFDPGGRDKLVPGAGGRKVLPIRVKKDAAKGTYRYTIYLNKVRQNDPEIIIEY